MLLYTGGLVGGGLQVSKLCGLNVAVLPAPTLSHHMDTAFTHAFLIQHYGAFTQGAVILDAF